MSGAWRRGLRIAAGLALAAALGCGRTHQVGLAVPNLPPMIELSAAPLPGDSVHYDVRFQWFAYDPDGEIARCVYAVDPPAGGDTVWVGTRARELTISFPSDTPTQPLPPGQIPESAPHVFTIKAVDNEGLSSPPVFSAFTSYTVAPMTTILSPQPSRLAVASTPPSLRIRWAGVDPDGVTTKRPVAFRVKRVAMRDVQAALGLPSGQYPDQNELQRYFGDDAPAFASWDSLPGDSTAIAYEGLTPGQLQYFAVSARDEANAYEPRFSLDRNVLCFLPGTTIMPPKITVSTSYFKYTQSVGSYDLTEARVVGLPVPGGETVRLDWSAVASAGAGVPLFRWRLDPPDGELTEETRERDDQTWLWTQWSLEPHSLALGPFHPTSEVDELHRFYLEARDNVGAVSLVIVEIRAIARARDILVVDDFRGAVDRDFGPGDPTSFQPYGSYPTEAVLDTLMFAVGGVPYRHRPAGTLSAPGVFAGFPVDTLDYRFTPYLGVPLELLVRYRAVVWYTGVIDAFRTRNMDGGLCALRYINQPKQLNTLSAYLALGGKLWIFGDGLLVAPQVADQDYYYAYDREPNPGTFLYDELMLRSRFDVANAVGTELTSMVPYLPGARPPAAPWPPDTVTVAQGRGICQETRVGPGATRNLPRWDGLPCLTLTTEFPDWPGPMPTQLISQQFVSKPLVVTEQLDPSQPATTSTLDTLYLWHAVTFNPNLRQTNPDGKPVVFSYAGPAHGPVVWTNMPLWMFERKQLRGLADRVLGSFGFVRGAGQEARLGPGSAHGALREIQGSAAAAGAAAAGPFFLRQTLR